MELTIESYFSKEASQEFMSNSQYKQFLECEAQAMAQISGEYVYPTSPSMMQGKYVHAWNEGKLDQFKARHPEILTQKGTLRSEYQRCEEIIEVIKADSLFMSALAGQKEVIFTAEMFGAKWKILIDSYFPTAKRFGDLKVLKSLDDKFWNKELQLYEDVLNYRGYNTQVAIYAEIERLSNKRDEHFEPFIAIVTKEPTPDKAIVSYVSEEESHTEFIIKELAMVETNMPRILAVKSGQEKPIRCERCEYCLKTKVLSGTIHYTSFNLY